LDIPKIGARLFQYGVITQKLHRFDEFSLHLNRYLFVGIFLFNSYMESFLEQYLWLSFKK